jgi:hypothetical protein
MEIHQWYERLMTEQRDRQGIDRRKASSYLAISDTSSEIITADMRRYQVDGYHGQGSLPTFL